MKSEVALSGYRMNESQLTGFHHWWQGWIGNSGVPELLLTSRKWEDGMNSFHLIKLHLFFLKNTPDAYDREDLVFD